MAFRNLYAKSTADPHSIDFATVGTRVKNKIPDAAIKAFRTKVPGPQAKPFDFKFDKDYDTGKLQITVKKAGTDFVYGWVDATFAANKSKMISVEVEIDGWRTKVVTALQDVAKHHAAIGQWSSKIDTLDSALASNKVDDAVIKEHDAVKQGLAALANEAHDESTAILQFWNSGPNQGVVGLMKKHGLPVDQVAGERREADAGFAALQQSLKKHLVEMKALGNELAPLRKRCDDTGVKLFLTMNAKRDRKSELEKLQVAIQKDIGEIQGYKNSDFAGVHAKDYLKEANEFTKKSGAAWTKLSANRGEIDKTVTRVEELFQRMRILGGRVVQEYNTWQGPAIPRGGNMPKYQQMLKMVYDEYMADHTIFQNTLRSYKDALLKYKPKAVELAAKNAKAAGKAQAKQVKATAKAEAKAAKKR